MTNFGIKWNTEDLLKGLKPLSLTVDKNKRKKMYNRGAVHISEELEKGVSKLIEVKLLKTCMKSSLHLPSTVLIAFFRLPFEFTLW